VIELFALWREPREFELLAELDSELPGLGPADNAANRANSDNVDRELGARCN
jgi:hypothetical protein